MLCLHVTHGEVRATGVARQMLKECGMTALPASALASPTLAAGDRLARRNALYLAAAQALAGANASVIFATGAVTGSLLAPDPALATLPVSVFVAGMAAGTLPAGWISRTWGRRAAFVTLPARQARAPIVPACHTRNSARPKSDGPGAV